MAIRLTFDWARRGNTVPYPPAEGRVGHGTMRRNRGFADLRGRPEEAATVAEATESPELRAWLVDLAKPGSSMFSLGCDIGRRRKKAANDGLLHATGGYVQLLAVDYAYWEADEYKAVATPWAARVEAMVGSDHWELCFLLQLVQFNLDSMNIELTSLTVEFNARAATAAAATESRERLVRALRSEYVHSPSQRGA